MSDPNSRDECGWISERQLPAQALSWLMTRTSCKHQAMLAWRCLSRKCPKCRKMWQFYRHTISKRPSCCNCQSSFANLIWWCCLKYPEPFPNSPIAKLKSGWKARCWPLKDPNRLINRPKSVCCIHFAIFAVIRAFALLAFSKLALVN